MFKAGFNVPIAVLEVLSWLEWVMMALEVIEFVDLRMTRKEAFMFDRCSHAHYQIMVSKLLGNLVKAGIIFRLRW